MRTVQSLGVALLALASCGPVRDSRPGRELRVAVVIDPARHAAENRAERTYWDLYLREILDKRGLRADELEPGALLDAGRLARYATLLVGDLDLVPSETLLEGWVRGGGTLIGSRTPA